LRLKKLPLLKVQEEVYVYTILSSSRNWTTAKVIPTAGIGTITFVWLPRFQRAGPSTSLDKSEYLVVSGGLYHGGLKPVKWEIFSNYNKPSFTNNSAL
jgi:hypothetical protein